MGMAKRLYIDCFSGISGDMMAAALLDLGLDFQLLKNTLKKIDLHGYRIAVSQQTESSLGAKKFEVRCSKQPLRNYAHIKAMIAKSGLKEKVKKDCLDMFYILAQAEAEAHQCALDQVHFHEIGAVDSIVDIASVAIGMAELDIGQVWCAHIPLGRGSACSMHGRIPVPAPATIKILQGLPVYQGPFDFEATTPTGAAIIKKYARYFGDMPAGTILGSGMGAGSRKGTDMPNILRLISFKKCNSHAEETLRLLCANIDDLTPEIMADAAAMLLDQGALDAWVENILMKKGRPAFKLCAICPAGLENKIADLIFSQTTTLGIRSSGFRRHLLERRIEQVNLAYGQAQIKLGIRDGNIITAQPEHQSCARLAKKTGKPLKAVYDQVKQAYYNHQSP